MASFEDSRAEIISEMVRRRYEDPRVVVRYTSVGLWPAEESLVADHFPAEGCILDLGCGAGRTSVALAELGMKVVGVDLSQIMIRVARDQAKRAGVEVRFEVGDARRLEFPDESFDAVLFSYNGIELVPGTLGKEVVLDQIARLLRPNGIFMFTTHSLFALNRFIHYRLVSFLRYCAGRFFGWPVRERELGERFNDQPEEEVVYLQVWPPFMWLRALRARDFDILCYNTRKRLEQGRRWSVGAIVEDGERFYVARKY